MPFPSFLDNDLTAALADKGRDKQIFSAPNGGVLRVSHWRPRVFNPARDSLGADFPRITPHDPRHTAAFLVVSASGNVPALARMLGHESPKLTLETYADLFDADLDALAQVLNQARTAAFKRPPSIASESRAIEHKSGFRKKNVPGEHTA